MDWNQLTHAYGCASNIPDLLASAQHAPPPQRYDQEPWYSLWSALCHQGDVYTASYAAMPRLVEIAVTSAAGVARECLLLAASIEMERHSGRAPAVPGDVRSAYDVALREGKRLAEALIVSAADDLDRRVFSGAIEAFSGRIASARNILDPEE